MAGPGPLPRTRLVHKLLQSGARERSGACHPHHPPSWPEHEMWSQYGPRCADGRLTAQTPAKVRKCPTAVHDRRFDVHCGHGTIIT